MVAQCCTCYTVRGPNGNFRDHGLKQCVGSWQGEPVSHTYCPVCKQIALRDIAAIGNDILSSPLITLNDIA